MRHQTYQICGEEIYTKLWNWSLLGAHLQYIILDDAIPISEGSPRWPSLLDRSVKPGWKNVNFPGISEGGVFPAISCQGSLFLYTFSSSPDLSQ